MARNKDSIRITLNVTKRCNRGCNHCYMSCVDKPSPYLKASDVSDLLEQYGEFSSEQIKRVAITGGEPFMNPEILDIFDVLGRSEKVESIGIISSGFLTSDPEIKLFKKLLERKYVNKVDFGISFNGYAKSFPERIENTLELLLNSRAKHFYIQSAADCGNLKETHKQLEKILRKKRFYPWLALPKKLDPEYTEAYTDTRGFIPMEEIVEDAILEDILWVGWGKKRKKVKTFRIYYFLIHYDGRAEKLLEDGFFANYCPMFSGIEPPRKIIIDCDKKVYPFCNCIAIKGMHLGELGKDSLEELFRRSRSFRERITGEILLDKKLSSPIGACKICREIAFNKKLLV